MNPGGVKPPAAPTRPTLPRKTTMPDLPPARSLLPTAPATCHDLVVLTYDERLIRRKRLTTVHDESFLVDLPAVTNLDDFWGFSA